MSDERFASDRSIFSEALTFVELSRVTIADDYRYLIIVALPNLAPQQVPERPSGASRMQENLLVAGAPLRILLRELGALPQTP